jgi:hypothetical protein
MKMPIAPSNAPTSGLRKIRVTMLALFTRSSVAVFDICSLSKL